MPEQIAPRQTVAPQQTVAPGQAPAPGQAAEYPELVAMLVAMREALAREQAEVHAWCAEQQAAARAAVERASAAVDEAAAEVAAAEAQVARVDFWARRLWGDLGNRLSRGAANRRGPVPPPAPAALHPNDQADRLIGEVRVRLAAAPVVQVLHSWAYPLMAVSGAGCAAALTRLALALGGPVWSRAILLVAAPALGLAPARLIARLQRCGLDAWAIALTLGAGALTTAALLLAR
jgi:hypothetical protein